MHRHEGKPFKAVLTTKGRKTGRAHSVMLLAVMYQGKIFFSRHKPDSDWYLNALGHPQVLVSFDEERHVGNCSEVTDESLGDLISELKYPGEQKAKEKRVAIQVEI